jgi:hypothetical protein
MISIAGAARRQIILFFPLNRLHSFDEFLFILFFIFLFFVELRIPLLHFLFNPFLKQDNRKNGGNSL